MIVPRIILPEHGEGKFVQLYVREEPYFRCNDWKGHAMILKEALEDFSLEFGWMKNRNGDHIPKHWKLGVYQAIGMGFLINDKGIFINKESISIDYEIGPNKEHLDEISHYLPEGKEFKII